LLHVVFPAQHITYNEWLPLVLGVEYMEELDIGKNKIKYFNINLVGKFLNIISTVRLFLCSKWSSFALKYPEIEFLDISLTKESSILHLFILLADF
jgi:hypothetical protein